MPLVDLVDETFLVVSPARLAAEFADPDAWPSWWPELSLELAEDRGLEGVRWRVTGRTGGVTGTSEVWLEPFKDGTIVHFYLRVDPTDGVPAAAGRRRRLADRMRHTYAVDFKRRLNALKDELETGRAPGERTPGREE